MTAAEEPAASERATRRASPVRLPLDSVVTVAGLVLAWTAYTHLGGVQAFLLPAPDAVWFALVDGVSSGTIGPGLLFTIRSVVFGFMLGSLAGAALGFVLAAMPRVERWLEGPILFLQAAPKIALAPLFVIWFGLGIASKLVLVVSLVLFPVMVGTLLGIRSVDPRLRDLARVLRLGRWQRVRRIELPAALPEIFIGLRIGAVQALVGAVLGEWMSGSDGLGAVMTQASAAYETPLLFAAVLLVVALGTLLHVALGSAERRVMAWRS